MENKIDIDAVWKFLHDFSIPTWQEVLSSKTKDGGKLDTITGMAKSTEYVNLILTDENKIFNLNKDFIREYGKIIAEPNAEYEKSAQTNNAYVDFKRFHKSNSILISVSQHVIRKERVKDKDGFSLIYKDKYKVFNKKLLIKEDSVWIIKSGNRIRQCFLQDAIDIVFSLSGFVAYKKDVKMDFALDHLDKHDVYIYVRKYLKMLLLGQKIEPFYIHSHSNYGNNYYSINKLLRLGERTEQEYAELIHPIFKTDAGKWVLESQGLGTMVEAFKRIATKDLVDFINGFYELKDLLYFHYKGFGTYSYYSYLTPNINVLSQNIIDEKLNKSNVNYYSDLFTNRKKPRRKISERADINTSNFKDFGIAIQ